MLPISACDDEGSDDDSKLRKNIQYRHFANRLPPLTQPEPLNLGLAPTREPRFLFRTEIALTFRRRDYRLVDLVPIRALARKNLTPQRRSLTTKIISNTCCPLKEHCRKLILATDDVLREIVGDQITISLQLH
jgi:hypothetical protein